MIYRDGQTVENFNVRWADEERLQVADSRQIIDMDACTTPLVTESSDEIILTERIRLLIVDDEPFNLIALEGLLNMMNIEDITKAFHGKQALDMIIQRPQYFDAILTDNQMPEMLGIELAQNIRNL